MRIHFRNPDRSEQTFGLLVARTVEEVTRGLSGVAGPWLLNDANADGMIFAFRRPIRMRMTVRETLMPLHFAFVDDQSVVTRVTRSEPRAARDLASSVPSRWIVEVDARKWPIFGVQEGARLVTLNEDREG